MQDRSGQKVGNALSQLLALSKANARNLSPSGAQLEETIDTVGQADSDHSLAFAKRKTFLLLRGDELRVHR